MLKRVEIKRLIFFASEAQLASQTSKIESHHSSQILLHSVTVCLYCTPCEQILDLHCCVCRTPCRRREGGRLNDWSMQLCLIQGKYTLIRCRCASPYVSLSHSLSHSLESERWIWLLKERDYNNSFSKECWMKSALLYGAQACTKPAELCDNTQTNKWKMKYKTITNKPHTPVPSFKSPPTPPFLSETSNIHDFAHASRNLL